MCVCVWGGSGLWAYIIPYKEGGIVHHLHSLCCRIVIKSSWQVANSTCVSVIPTYSGIVLTGQDVSHKRNKDAPYWAWGEVEDPWGNLSSPMSPSPFASSPLPPVQGIMHSAWLWIKFTPYVKTCLNWKLWFQICDLASSRMSLPLRSKPLFCSLLQPIAPWIVIAI